MSSAHARPKEPTLTARTVRGTAVQVVSSFGLNGLALVQGILFARWFAPAQLGLLDTTNLVVRTTLLFSQLGTRQALIREGEGYRRRLRSALSFDAMVSTVTFLVLVLGAPLFARLFRSPELTFWVRALAVTAYATTLALPSTGWDREMRFGIAKVPRAAGTAVTLAVTGAAALGWGLGAEALLWGALAGFGAEHALIWVLAPHRPRPGWNTEDVRSLATFTGPLLLSALASYLVFEGDDLLLRLFRDNATLAVYRKSFEWPFYLTTLVAMTSAVLYPALVQVEGQAERVRRAFHRTNRYLALVTVPAGMALAWFAAPLVAILYGAAWSACVPLLRIFALAFMLRVSTGYNWHLLPMSRGDTRSILRVSLISAALTLLLGLPLIYGHGAIGGAVTNVLVALLWALPARLWVIRREVGSLAVLRDVPRPLAAATAAIAPFLILAAPATLVALTAQLALYGVLYATLILLLLPGLAAEVRDLLRVARRGA